MSGYVFATAACVNCSRVFTFNPHKVPSIKVNLATMQYDENAPRQPVCRLCVERSNEQRAAAGKPTISILPGAYEPMPEEEL